MRLRSLSVIFPMLACGGTPLDDAPRAPTAALERDATANPGARESAPRRPSASEDPPALPLECQAPLVVIEEVTRFLTVAATHATTSASCVDGPGRRVRIDEIHVCPMAPHGDRRPFAASYRVTTYPEGGRQMCGNECPPVQPQTSRHRIELMFRPATGGHGLDPVERVPGLPPDATPPTKAHDGDCYGDSPAYQPATIPLP